MKKLIQLITLCMMAAVLAISALAQQASPSPATSPAAAAPAQDDADAKAALYTKVTENIRTNQQVAYEAAKEYLQRWPNDSDQYANYLKDFAGKYEKGKLRLDMNKALEAKQWPQAFTMGKQILSSSPDDLQINLNTSWSGLQMALSNNDANNAEASTVSRKTIQLIESGKTLEEGKPYAEKDKQEALGFLNFSLGLYALKNNNPNEAAAQLIKAVQYESIYGKNNPNVYAKIASIYEGEYGRLQEAYDARFKDKPETDESKAALQQVKQFLEPMIDAYARTVAYSGDTPAYQQVKTASKQRLEELYKFARGSTDGLDALIAGVKTKPVPPQPNAPTIAPAAPTTTSTPTMPATSTPNQATGTNTGATAPATTAPASTNNTTPKPATTPAKPGTKPNHVQAKGQKAAPKASARKRH